jgi:hypothetical protein
LTVPGWPQPPFADRGEPDSARAPHAGVERQRRAPGCHRAVVVQLSPHAQAAVIPADTFQLFLATGSNSRVGTLVAAMHIGTVALLGACAISGTLRVDVRRLMRYSRSRRC